MITVDEYFEHKQVPEDSLELMDMILDVEDDFDITIPDKEYTRIKTKEDFIVLVKEKVNGKIN